MTAYSIYKIPYIIIEIYIASLMVSYLHKNLLDFVLVIGRGDIQEFTQHSFISDFRISVILEILHRISGRVDKFGNNRGPLSTIKRVT